MFHIVIVLCLQFSLMFSLSVSHGMQESCFTYHSSIITNKRCDAVPYDDHEVPECTSVLSTWQMCTGVQNSQIMVNFTTEQLKLMKEFLKYQRKKRERQSHH